MSALNQIINHIQLPIENAEQAQRLFHGRGHAYDGLHHITIDWLPPVLLITLFAPEKNSDIKDLADQLLYEIPNCKSIQLQHRYELHGPIDVIYTDNIDTNYDDLIIEENKLKYQLQLGKQRNTGLFLDMKMVENGYNSIVRTNVFSIYFLIPAVSLLQQLLVAQVLF